LRAKLKEKYVKLFILAKSNKDELLEVLPLLLGKAISLIVEKHIKNGKLIMKSEETELELY
jgi:hypothetical protein